ncbi:hypothetical protein EIN_091960 [Entamoeba invadens IP1]|uniref:Uncharacterized protein n=1 Tax=Entamoeba invadens IP1 TaxID=370355 RepID=A0A0A1TYM7_ENTIV|nr:hypothetical protein EIN_091960 [Entamoeba invadens IP1]ELP86631.1 hypothetical protein EIN_091960 [Entamoeba invadens IP1]|eukprot:XP_004185977.1 hypothetical protein EIN_091960 [Entamoeba invadens IP1]
MYFSKSIDCFINVLIFFSQKMSIKEEKEELKREKNNCKTEKRENLKVKRYFSMPKSRRQSRSSKKSKEEKEKREEEKRLQEEKNKTTEELNDKKTLDQQKSYFEQLDDFKLEEDIDTTKPEEDQHLTTVALDKPSTPTTPLLNTNESHNEKDEISEIPMEESYMRLLPSKGIEKGSPDDVEEGKMKRKDDTIDFLEKRRND